VQVKCATCKYFVLIDHPSVNDGDSDEGLYGLCDWSYKNLPYSLRYASRERTGVYSETLIECSQHRTKEKSNANISTV